jgi:hypothetical protein
VLWVIHLIFPVHDAILDGQRTLAALGRNEVRIARLAVGLILVLHMRTILEDQIASLASEAVLMEGLAHRVGHLSQNHLGANSTRWTCSNDLSAIGRIVCHFDFDVLACRRLLPVRPCSAWASRDSAATWTRADAALCEGSTWARADSALCKGSTWTRADTTTATDASAATAF